MIRNIAKALLRLAARRGWPRVQALAIEALGRWHARQPNRDDVQVEADRQLETRLRSLALRERLDVIGRPSGSPARAALPACRLHDPDAVPPGPAPRPVLD